MKGLNYRLFPLYCLAFLRVANNVSVGLATPLYFIDIGLSPDIIGFIVSATALAYLFAPTLFKNAPKRIKIKKCLIISVGGFLIVQIFYQISLDPLLVFILRFLDGCFLGLFWPVLIYAISFISTFEGMRDNDILKDKLMKNYSLSWNIGGILSYLFGTIILYIVDDVLLIFDMAFIFALTSFILVFIFEEPKSNFSEEILRSSDEKIKSNSQRENIKFPVFIPLFIIAIYAFILGAIGLIYPAKSEHLNFAIFTNYLFFFIRLGTQTLFIALSMNYSINFFKKIMPYLMVLLTVSLVVMGLNENLLIFGIIFMILGLTLSFFYSFSFKLTVFRNITENTSKYGTFFESIVGLFFFLGPIISGFIIYFDINTMYFILSFIMVLGFIFYMLVKQKLKVMNEKNIHINKIV